MFKWRKNHACELPQLVGFVDTETRYYEPYRADFVGRHRFRLGAAHFGRYSGGSVATSQAVSFTTVDHFWRAVSEWSQPKKVLWVYAHNILFDLWILGFPEMVESGSIELTKYPIEFASDSDENGTKHKPWKGLCSIDRDSVIIHARYNGRRINFVDSMNYFRCSLGSLGESIGLPKLPMPGPSDPDEIWLTYCRRDVDIIREAVSGLMREWKLNDLGNWQPTIAGLAYSGYRHKFAEHLPVCHEIIEVSNLEHDAYYDGRTEPLFIGDIRPANAGGSLFGSPNVPATRPWIDGPVYLCDVQGMYASVMQTEDYPYRALGNRDSDPTIVADFPLTELAGHLADYAAIASVKLATTEPWYPAKRDNKTIYPIGQFTTTLATPELQLALDSNHIVNVNWIIFYHKAAIFRQWVEYWWQRRLYYRQQNNCVGAELCKLLLNSLAGKFAQKNRQWKNTIKYCPREPWSSWCDHDMRTQKTARLRSIGWTVQELVDGGYARHALVAVSAHVNSYARVRMLQTIRNLPSQSVLYQGNDSLLLTQAGYDALVNLNEIVDNQLGKFTLKGVASEGAIFGPRDYELDGETRKAGLPKGSVPDGKRRWRVQRFEDAASLLAREPDGSVHVHSQIVRAGDATGSIGVETTGWTVRPVLLER